MAYRIAADMGGTFTDVVVAGEDKEFHLSKALTNHDDAFASISDALQVTCDDLDITLTDLLASTGTFVYGSTRATNAIIEGKTARTAFVTTKGFRDTLLLREGGKPNAYDFSTPFPEPYVPRRLSFEVDERIDAEGNVYQPLDEEAARAVLRQVKESGAEAIGVSLLWSVANPQHEIRIGQLIEEELPEVPFTLSHQINPIIREYRRASSTVIDASLKPLMQDHLASVERDLIKAGFTGEIYSATSNGGMMEIEDMVRRPIYATRSGPSLAPIAGRTYGGAEMEARNIVVCDTGGTSFDVSMVRDNEIVFTRDTWLGGRFLGHLTGLSSVDARSIGAGGGSIAWVDDGGLLRVGPYSAGSDPGPAAYGTGGVRPTVTDAAVVLGYLDPEFFHGGRMALDVDAARTSIASIAEPLGLSTEKTAEAVLRISSEHMVQAVQEITINEGIDPRDCLLVAGGGAAGLGVGLIARELGMKEFLLPRTAGGLSASGAQFSDIVIEEGASFFTSSGDFDADGVSQAIAKMDKELDKFEAQFRNRGLTTQRTYSVDARYQNQNWELEVPVLTTGSHGDFDIHRMVEEFHAIHERVFAVKDPNSEVELLGGSAWLTASVGDSTLVQGEASGKGATPAGQRETFFPETGVSNTPYYTGSDLAIGSEVRGPAIIEEPTTTLVVYPGMVARVTPFKNYLVEVES